MNIKKYNVSSFYMLRTPLNSLQTYKKTFIEKTYYKEQKNKLCDLYRDKSVIEAIEVASRDLYMAIKKDFEKGDIKDETLLAYAKYVIRMCSRATPFGLFSGVDIGNFEKNTDITLKSLESNRKRARIDLEWLCNVIKLIEEDDIILKNLDIKFNPLCFCKGDRIVNPYLCNGGVSDLEESKVLSSIRYTSQVEFVRNKCKDFINFNKLFNIIIDLNPNVNQDKIFIFLKGLLKNEFLISELRFPLVNTNPLDYVLTKISNIGSARNYFNKLIEIKELITKYNSKAIGEGVEDLNLIIEKMKSLYKCKNYIQVDTKVESISNKLSFKVAEEIEDLVEALIKLSDENIEFDHITEYKNSFIEKYGHYMEIPISQLLDPDLGLGAPAGYTRPISNRFIKQSLKSKKILELKELLRQKYLLALKEKRKEIFITEKEINVLYESNSQIKEDDLSDSIEIYVQILAKDEKHIDNGDFKLAISGCMSSLSAGKSFGRFSDLINDSGVINHIEKEKRKNIDYDWIEAELFEFPSNGRLGNVALNNNNIDYQIAIATNGYVNKKEIKIDDIVVGVDPINNKFYAKSKILNKKIIIRNSNMLNVLNDSNISRFLKDISCNCKINILDTLHNIFIDEFIYCPRISYKKTILMFATWKLSKKIIGISKSNSFNIMKSKFRDYQNIWEIPRFVYYKEYDNTLLIDTENDLQLKILLNYIIKSDNDIIITELEDNFNSFWVKDINNNKYSNEFVIPLICSEKNKKNKKNKVINTLETTTKVNNNTSKITPWDKKRILIFGNENWIYFKLFYMSNRLNDLICIEIKNFCENLKKNNDIKLHFYINYSIPSNHIRLRIKANDNKNIFELMTKFEMWFNELMSKGFISNVNIDIYIRELERYGGEELIECAEKYFCEDSILVENILNMKRENVLTLSDESIGIINMIEIMKCFGLNLQEQEEWLSKLVPQKSYREDFKRNQSKFIELSKSIITLENPEINSLLQLMKERQKKLIEYKREIDINDRNNNLTNTKEDILSSIIHMFFNRFRGDNEFERKVRALTRHSIYAFLQYNKKYLGIKYED